MATNSVNIIGVNHATEEFGDLQLSLVHKAINRELVLGLEGFLRNKDYEDYMASQIGKKASGFFYGIEDEYYRTFTTVFFGYYALALNKESKGIYGEGNPTSYEERVINAKRQLILDLVEYPISRDLLKRSIDERIISSNTLRLIDSITRITSVFDSGVVDPRYTHFIADNIFKNSVLTSQFGNNEDWLDLYRKLGDETVKILQSLPEEYRPDIALINDFFKSETSLEDSATVSEVGKWREKSMVKNMKYVIERGIEFEKDTYFLVGFAHRERLEKCLRELYSGLNIASAGSMLGIPEEYKHLIQ